MSTGYSLAYRFGITPWDRAGAASAATLEVLLDREQEGRARPFGRALDLGCGRGVHTHELARRGWEAVGVDNIPRAIHDARSRPDSQATFLIGDVRNLRALELGTFDFFFDVGCFHGLDQEDRRAEGEGLSGLATPHATLLMLAFQPHRLPFVPSGVTEEDIKESLPDWQLLTIEPADTTGMPLPLKRTSPQWYRFSRTA